MGALPGIGRKSGCGCASMSLRFGKLVGRVKDAFFVDKHLGNKANPWREAIPWTFAAAPKLDVLRGYPKTVSGCF